MERLKIAHITPYYYPSIGGVSTQAQYIAEGLVERGHYVDVLTAYKDHSSRPPLEAPKREIINNVNIFRYKSILNIGHMSFMPGLITHFFHNKYDVLHYHVYRHPLTDISSFFGRINSSVNVLQGQGPFFEPGEIGVKKAFLYTLYDSLSRFFVLNFSDIILALNEYEKERFKRILRDDKKIKIIPSAADSDSFTKKNTDEIIQRYNLKNKTIILFVGNLDSNKRPDLLVQILPSIVKQFPDILVLFVGRDEGMLNYCKDLSNKLEVTKNVRFLGYISDADKHALYEAADIFALISDKEAFGTVLVEAMAHQLPVVVTDARGPKSVVQDGINGLIVKRNNTSSLAEAILRLLKEDGLRKQLAINARISAENNYSIKNIVLKIESYYYSKINERKALIK